MNIGLSAISLIGFGEAGSAFAEGWQIENPNIHLRTYDIKTGHANASVVSAKWEDYSRLGVDGQASAGDAVVDATAIFSLVTADQATNAAQSVAEFVEDKAFFFDCNSCAPDAKTRSAQVLETRGCRYVDVAVMSPVHPKLHKTPLLISGPHSDDALVYLSAMGMDAKIIPGKIGSSSSVKMIRSIMMKGLEALVLECVLSGRKAGVDDLVLDSLEVTYPGFNWKDKAAYMFERVMTHGVRRASELREVVKTVDSLGVTSETSKATVGWMQAVGELGLDATQISTDDYTLLADAILSKLDENESDQKARDVNYG